jgi:6-phosphogluconolactonase
MLKVTILLAAFAQVQVEALVAHTNVLPDGRLVHIVKNDVVVDSVGDFIVERVGDLATDAIAKKGAFSMSIGSGTTVQPLELLAADSRVDLSKVHVFFGNERTEGDAAGKCAKSGAGVFAALGLPASNLHLVPELPAKEAAEAYEATMRDLPPEIVGVCDSTGLPSLDLCLLGSGADGHCASLYPNSAQVVCSPGCSSAYLPAEGKGGITLSIDAINSARNVLISAAKASQSDMARKCLAWSNAATNHKLPAGMISTSEGAVVEWVLSQESAADLPAM